MDWRVGNLGFEGDRCSAIYDLDSLALCDERVAVGSASAQFSADWGAGGRLPTVPEMRAFVAEYEEAMGRTFDAEERVVVDAANLLQCAYGARCQHSDAILVAAWKPDPSRGWIAVLRDRMKAGPL